MSTQREQADKLVADILAAIRESRVEALLVELIDVLRATRSRGADDGSFGEYETRPYGRVHRNLAVGIWELKALEPLKPIIGMVTERTGVCHCCDAAPVKTDVPHSTCGSCGKLSMEWM